MIESRRCASLLHEARLPRRIRHRVARQDLNGHGTIQLGVERAIDHAHAALPELRFDPEVEQASADHYGAEFTLPCPPSRETPRFLFLCTAAVDHHMISVEACSRYAR